MKNIALFTILICSFLQVNAQDYKADFEQAFSIFQGDMYEVEMEYILFPSHTATQSTEREMMSMKKDGKRFRMHQFGMEVICDNEHVLMINERSKFIAIDKKREQSAPTEADKEATSALGTALADLEKAMGLDTINISPEDTYNVDYTGAKNGQKAYEFNYQYGEYEKIIAYIDAATNRMSKYIMYYRQPMEIEAGKFSKVRVEVNFLKQSNTPDFKNKPFDIQKHISIKSNGKVKVHDQYSDYNIINHLSNGESWIS